MTRPIPAPPESRRAGAKKTDPAPGELSRQRQREASAARAAAGGESSDALLRRVVEELDEMKAEDVRELDVRELTNITDYMVVATGRTGRHVRSIAEKVALSAKHRGEPALGVEGEQEAEWVLVDLCDVVLHVMQPETRELYQLEKFWSQMGELREDEEDPNADSALDDDDDFDDEDSDDDGEGGRGGGGGA